MEHIWNGLSEIELRALLDHPGVLEDKLFVAALRAVQAGISKERLSNRMKNLAQILDLPRLDLELLRQWNKVVVFDIQEIDRPIRKPKKYSGYVKSPSAVGGKRSSKINLDPGIFEWSSMSEIDLFVTLTVGDFIGESLVIHLPDEGPIVPKRLKNVSK
jgi:hypothetical protein